MDASAVLFGDLDGPVGVYRDEVERRPIDTLEGYGGITDLAAEPVADDSSSFAEETVDASRDLWQLLAKSMWRLQQCEPVVESITG